MTLVQFLRHVIDDSIIRTVIAEKYLHVPFTLRAKYANCKIVITLNAKYVTLGYNYLIITY